MDVSIIIINYNTFQFTNKCIRSIYQYTKGLQFEIILVDNASIECDPLLFKQEFPDIILIKNTTNVGFAKANNIGIQSAKGDMILLLNSDTELVENSIAKCSEKLKKQGNETAAITCKLIYLDGSIQKQCSRFPTISSNLLELLRIHKFFSQKKTSDILFGTYFSHESDCIPDWIWGTFFMFRRSSMQLLPGKKLNEDYFMYWEDVKWCYDFKSIGKNVFYFAGTQVIHEVGQSSKNTESRMKLIIFNELDWVAKTHSKFYMIVYSIARGFNVLFSGSQNSNRSIYFKLYLNSAFRIL